MVLRLSKEMKEDASPEVGLLHIHNSEFLQPSEGNKAGVRKRVDAHSRTQKEVQKGNSRSRSRPQVLACYAPLFQS